MHLRLEGEKRMKNLEGNSTAIILSVILALSVGIIKQHRLQRVEKAERELAEEKLSLPVGGGQFPVSEPRGVLEEEKREAEEREK